MNNSSDLPLWARMADVATVSLLALAVWCAFGGGLDLSIAGLRISIHNATRLLIEAVLVWGARHALVREPTLHDRLRFAVARLGPPLHDRLHFAVARLGPPMLAFGLPAVVYLAVLVHRYDGGPYLRGDCADYYRTARSILEDGDLDISNQFPPPLEANWSGASVAIDGRLVPKHPIPMPIASVPFVAVLGPSGALVFNLVQLGCLLGVLYHLARRISAVWPAAAAVALTGVATFIPHYVWNYSPDVFASLVLAAALIPLTSRESGGEVRRYVLGGLLAGLAVIAKQPLVVFLPTVFGFCRRPIGRSALALAAGLSISLGAFGLHNARLFGSPFVTAYDRIAVREGSSIGIFSQRRSFTLPVSEGAWGQLFDSRHGLAATSAVTLLSLAGLPVLAARSRALAAHVSVGSVALFLLFSMYDQWNASHYGNRFLLPAVTLSAIPLAAGLDALLRRFSAVSHRSASRAGREPLPGA